MAMQWRSQISEFGGRGLHGFFPFPSLFFRVRVDAFSRPGLSWSGFSPPDNFTMPPSMHFSAVIQDGACCEFGISLNCPIQQNGQKRLLKATLLSNFMKIGQMV
jgi:hypothetical protein